MAFFDGFLSAFFLNLLTELGDKTQLAALLLSAKFKSRGLVLAGVCAGFLVWVSAEVLLGHVFSAFLPREILNLVSGFSFIAFGVYSIRQPDGHEKINVRGRNAFVSSFILLLLTEIGDKSQLANIILAAQYPALEVFGGALAGLWLLMAVTVFVGRAVFDRVDKTLVAKASGALFIAFGILFAAGL